jgi:glycosyltransferase involved in cell wall biosynthesis
VISLILPYWNRQEATDAALCRMSELYIDLDLEVIVVDDGSPKPYIEPTLLPLDIQVVRLPF